jgi:hypothetical protein
VLWDKQRHTIVSNESAEILRMFNGAFDGSGAAPGDSAVPLPALRGETKPPVGRPTLDEPHFAWTPFRHPVIAG